MVKKREYDFLTYTSFPSSAKLYNDDGEGWIEWIWSPLLRVNSGDTIQGEVNAKQENIVVNHGGLVVDLYDRNGKKIKRQWPWPFQLPQGSFDWMKFEGSIVIPDEVFYIKVTPTCGAGTKEKPGIIHYDELKVSQNGALIYEDDFTDWIPIIGAATGAILGGVAGEAYKPIGPIASPLIGAALGGAIGAGIGALATQPTTISTVTIPQIAITSPRSITVK